MQIRHGLGVLPLREILNRRSSEVLQSVRVSHERVSKHTPVRQFCFRLLCVAHAVHAPRRQRGVEHFNVSFGEKRFVSGADAVSSG